MADGLVKNTLAFKFPDGAPSPSLVDLARFVKNFDADKASMETSYKIAEERSIFIKFKTSDAMKDAVAQNAEIHKFSYSSGGTVDVTMAVAGCFTKYVRIFDLPPEITDSDIAAVLGKYGSVKRLIREKFPAELELDLFTGVRGVHIDVKREIPGSLFFMNRRGRIYYEGLKQKCFLCKEEGHIKVNCPQNKQKPSRDVRKVSQLPGVPPSNPAGNDGSGTPVSQPHQGVSYAGAVQTPVSKRIEPELQLKMTTLSSVQQKGITQTEEENEERIFTEVFKGFAEQELMEMEEDKRKSASKRHRSPASACATTDEDGFTQQTSRKARRAKKGTLAVIVTEPKGDPAVAGRSRSK